MNIVLHEPEIPFNTGAIGRTCVATKSTLHLIKPYGFILNDKNIKKAGMDYWSLLKLREYISYEEFIKGVEEEKREMDINAEIANSVSLLMFQQGRKSVELAQLLGVSEFTSSRLRSGTTTWKVAYIKVAADWLGVTVTDLTNGYTVVPKKPPADQDSRKENAS